MARKAEIERAGVLVVAARALPPAGADAQACIFNPSDILTCCI